MLQVVNHGVNSLLVENVKSEIERFFELPMDDKTQYGQKQGEGEGFGQHFVQSDDQRLDWADMFFMVTRPLHFRKPYLFPLIPTPLRLIDYTPLMNYYPPCPTPELVIGLTPHSDFTGLTILLQVNEVEGLQIRKEERWISIKPLPNAFIVNIGDIMTNGIYRSIEHRAIINSTKKRLSIATFHEPKLELEVGPIPSLITPETPAVFGRFAYEELLEKCMIRKLDGKSFLDHIRIGKSD
ncbi:hypothetical protein MKW92_041388 [Papaver armeniacum]|nr:hypothetical protein MKW92_041388 [Papaver armeniacum]